jgi:hypothetical protein
MFRTLEQKSAPNRPATSFMKCQVRLKGLTPCSRCIPFQRKDKDLGFRVRSSRLVHEQGSYEEDLGLVGSKEEKWVDTDVQQAKATNYVAIQSG